ncbi:secretin N-terminal domain-containing protein [Pantoea cypripedii]|uniref:Bacterial type II and III secretion system family protein n=1 Tax=Pantoea cypripedii TaxID=55209 RepID=A0A6B9GF54_PANCY|nr:secretin N-terminal domain-containing protein [Pantoea cypripedii]QGY32259.1 bacterial type II and III secretion system family protein [Pantoea cypripedii]
MKKVTFTLSILGALLSGCAEHNLPQTTETVSLHSPESMAARLVQLDRERVDHPNNISLRAEQTDLTNQLIASYLRQAEVAVRRNNYELAAENWKSALLYQPGNLRAQQGLRKINAWRAVDKTYREAVKLSTKDPELALRKVKQVLEEDPNWPQGRALRDHLLREISMMNQPAKRLSRELQKPISLNYRQHNLMAIFSSISQMTGVNIIFDKDVSSSATTSIIAKDTTAEDAIDVLLMSNNLRKKALNANTLLIYPATAQKEKVYREIVVKTIFLAYAKAKDVNVALRNLVKLKDVHVDERTNSVTIRGSEESVDKAERLLVTLDRPEAEVTLAVEVLEVNTEDVQKLGMTLPQHAGVSFGKVGEDSTSSNTNSKLPLSALSPRNMLVSIDGMSLDMKQVLSHAKVLASPRIRVKNNKKALVDIGQKIPVLTSNASSDGFLSQKVEYQDVGMKLEVTPDISMDDNISMEVKFTLSSLGTPQPGKDGAVYYSTNSREANTVLSSSNGETQMLAGLIKQEDIDLDSGVPYLSKIPGIGRLFSNKGDEKKRTEVILLITPTIERNLDLPGSHVSTIDMGTDELTGENLQLRGAAPEHIIPNFEAPRLAPPAQFPDHSAGLPPPVIKNEQAHYGTE